MHVCCGAHRHRYMFMYDGMYQYVAVPASLMPDTCPIRHGCGVDTSYLGQQEVEGSIKLGRRECKSIGYMCQTKKVGYHIHQYVRMGLMTLSFFFDNDE